MKRRDFLQGAASIGVAPVLAAGSQASSLTQVVKDDTNLDIRGLPRPGPKEVVEGKKAVAASQHPIVTDLMVEVLRDGGNAIDAAIAGQIVQATVQQDMTNHAGTVSMIYYEAKSGKLYQLNSMGTLVPHLPLFRPYPPGVGGLAGGAACIPGFMPGMKAMHQRFASKSWKSLVEPSVKWAENGHRVDEFTFSVLHYEAEAALFFPSQREIFAPDGFIPSVGSLWKNPKLAETLDRLAQEGPDYFITGAWGQEFVETANKMGWAIKMSDMTASEPRWQDPLRYTHRGYEVVQQAPPERQGVYCAMVLGILDKLNIRSLGHYTQSADSLYYFGHALRRAAFELGQLWDPQDFDVPLEVWMSEDFHAQIASILKNSRPKAHTDLTEHARLSGNQSELAGFGFQFDSAQSRKPKQPSGSCEIVVVDEQGNWVQAMNTLQSGGIPGIAIGGVPMTGSHVHFGMDFGISGWLGLEGHRMRSVLSNTLILKGGKPVYSLGSPGNVHCTVPQVISNILDFGMHPYEAGNQPRMLPMDSNFTIPIETRISDSVVRDLVKMGGKVKPLPPYDFHMGSYQQAFRDPGDGTLGACVGMRRAGVAGGY